MVQRTHSILQWLFAIFVLYLLLTRLLISWVQFFPEQFIGTVSKLTGAQIQAESIDIDQDWLGFQLKLENLKIETNEIVFQAKKLDTDINTFFFTLPSVDYGDFLILDAAAYQIKKAVEPESQSLNFKQRPSLRTLSEALAVDINIDRLWQRIDIKDFVVSEIRPGLSLQIHELKSVKTAQLNFTSEFSLFYQGALDYERFSLKSRFIPNVWGVLEQGTFSLHSYTPLNIQKLSRFLSTQWQAVLPTGELLLDLQGKVVNSQLSDLMLKLNTQSLKWRQTNEGLPESLGLELNWLRAQQNIKKLHSDWRFVLSKIQIDNRFIDSVSPIELFFEGDDYLNFSAEKFDIEPFKVIVKALIETELASKIFDRAAYLNISNFKGKLDWQTLEVPNLDIKFDKLDLPVTDFPGMSLRALNIHKTPEKIEISTPKPVWLVSPIVKGKPMRIDLPKSFALGFDAANRAWALPKLQVVVDQMPIMLSLSQLNDDYVDLDLSAKISSMAKLKQYLPYDLMSKNLQVWLKNGLIGGEDIQLKGALRGLYKNFPFLNNDGQFTLKAEVKNADLNFNEKWPRLRNFDADIEFTPYQLKINSNAINVGANNTAENVEVIIANLDQKDIAVEVTGQVKTGFANAVNYLAQTPVSEKLGMTEFLTGSTEYSGDALININKIWVPVSGYRENGIRLPERVEGQVRLYDAGIKIHKYLDFKRINGNLNFNEKAVSAKNVKYFFHDGNATLDIVTNQKAKQVRLNSRGRAFEKANDYFEKSLAWNGQLTIPFKNAKKTGVNIALNADIGKAKSKLPVPFDADSLFNMNLTSNIQVLKQNVIADIAIPQNLNAQINLSKTAGEYQLDLLQAELGEVKNSKFKDSKNSFIRGEIGFVDLAAWQQYADFMPSGSDNPSKLNWDKSTLSISNLLLANQEFKDLSISWLPEKDKPLSFTLQSKTLAGQVKLKAQNEFDVDLKRLVLITGFDSDKREKGDSQSAVIENESLSCQEKSMTTASRKVNFKGKNIIVDGRIVNNLLFTLEQSPEKTEIKGLKGEFGSGLGHMSGSYIYQQASNSSTFKSSLKSNEVKALTKFLKINEGFTGKSAEADLNLTWPGNIECFQLNNVEGDVKFEAKEGSIEDIEPGIARLIGLLSVESLVRRLKLDLKDVTNKGMVYDQIKGKGNLKSSQLKLSKFELKAPSANANLKGSLDIEKQTFDLEAQITPKVGATVPTIAAIAGGANPLTALAVYTLMKVIPGVNENLVTYDYEITGPWSKPVINSKNIKPETETPKGNNILDLP